MMFGLGAEVYCTADAMICPDGTVVGRGGPNCEFTPCPAVLTTGEQALQVNAGIPVPTPAEDVARAGCKWWEEYYPIRCIAGSSCPQCRMSRGLLAGGAVVVGLVLWGLLK